MSKPITVKEEYSDDGYSLDGYSLERFSIWRILKNGALAFIRFLKNLKHWGHFYEIHA